MKHLGQSKFTLSKVMLISGVGLSALLIGIAPVQAAQAAAAPETAARSGNENEIVVTAQKREQSLQNVPISISVLSGQALDQSTQSLVEELGRVPGVAIVESNLGGSFISVRGVGATGTNFAGTSSVGFYLDSVPFGFVRSALVPNTSAFDLQRVEVLRGPQGTLYGASSQNGVVRVLTHDVEMDRVSAKFRGAVSSTEMGGVNFRGDAAVNVPLVDGKLAARLVAGYEGSDGWIDRPNRKNANNMDRLTLRGKLKAQPTDDLTLGLSIWHSELTSDARSTGFANGTTPVVVDEPMTERYNIYAFDTGYDFGGVSLTNSTSYMDYKSHIVTDTSFGQPKPVLSPTDFRSRIFSNELNLASTGDGPWRWTAGAIYRNVKDEYVQTSPAYLNPKGTAYNDYSSSFAVFAEITRKMFDDRLELSGGLRYFHDRTRTKSISVLNNVNAPQLDYESTSSKASPRVVLTWLPSPDLTFYASYSEGFRAGFPQNPTVILASPDFPAVKPDNLLNYEIGSKGSLGDGLFSYDVALFYIQRNGIQQILNVNAANGTGAPIRVSGVINGTSASGFGADIGLTVRPARGVSLGTNYSWNDLRLDADIVQANGTILYFKGDRSANSPAHTLSAWFDTRFPIGSLEGSFSGSLSYISRRSARVTVAGVRVLSYSDETFTSRASFGVTSPKGWGLSLFVDNLNNYNKTPIVDFFVSPSGSFRIRPRTIGLQFDYKL